MDVKDWLRHASEDAEAHGLPELKPLLETLAAATQALRDADAVFQHPAITTDGSDDDGPA